MGADKLKSGIAKIEGIKVLGEPEMSIISFASTEKNLNIYSVADVMEKSNWHMEIQQNPACIHLSIMPPHGNIIDRFIKELGEAVEEVRQNPSKYKDEGSTGMYGTMAKIPDPSLIDTFVNTFLDK